EFKKLGKTMIFVSHSIGQMKKFCEKVLWLEFGLVKDFGTVGEVIPKYEKFLREWQRMSKEEKEMYKDNALLQEGRGLNLVDLKLNNKKKMKNIEYTKNLRNRIENINGALSHIYTTLDNMKRISSEPYKNSAYYIKKEAFFHEERYFLLSNHPSAISG